MRSRDHFRNTEGFCDHMQLLFHFITDQQERIANNTQVKFDYKLQAIKRAAEVG